ncbi:MAG: ACT domain-containing protein [Firmicutes bacterium]|nr:ACT domain-containing protein [Bacillota bacterium]
MYLDERRPRPQPGSGVRQEPGCGATDRRGVRAGAKRTLSALPGIFAVCRLHKDAGVPNWALQGRWWSVARTPDELSVVCPLRQVPKGVPCEPGRRCLQVAGPLDFTLTGVLAALATPLAEAGVSLFAVSTYDTDYILVKAADLQRATRALIQAGHAVTAG